MYSKRIATRRGFFLLFIFGRPASVQVDVNAIRVRTYSPRRPAIEIQLWNAARINERYVRVFNKKKITPPPPMPVKK